MCGARAWRRRSSSPGRVGASGMVPHAPSRNRTSASRVRHSSKAVTRAWTGGDESAHRRALFSNAMLAISVARSNGSPVRAAVHAACLARRAGLNSGVSAAKQTHSGARPRSPPRGASTLWRRMASRCLRVQESFAFLGGDQSAATDQDGSDDTVIDQLIELRPPDPYASQKSFTRYARGVSWKGRCRTQQVRGSVGQVFVRLRIRPSPFEMARYCSHPSGPVSWQKRQTGRQVRQAGFCRFCRGEGGKLDRGLEPSERVSESALLGERSAVFSAPLLNLTQQHSPDAR